MSSGKPWNLAAKEGIIEAKPYARSHRVWPEFRPNEAKTQRPKWRHPPTPTTTPPTAGGP